MTRPLFASAIVVTAIACAGKQSTAPADAPRPVTVAAAPARRSGDREAEARHAVTRLTFGVRPGDLAVVREMGADRWIARQLDPERIDDGVAEQLLGQLETQRKKAYELLADYPTPEELNQRFNARNTGDMRMAPSKNDSMNLRLAQQKAQQLTQQIPVAKVLRATFAERQLLEMVVDFWENHFSVAQQKSPNRYSLVEYDRDVIRPRALGRFRDLLGAVAKSPQMLFYLDAWQNYVDSLHPTMAEARINDRRAGMSTPPLNDSSLRQIFNRRRTGRNENYARELLELHTLGVNGGYTQQDVIEIARCLTGWTIDGPQLGGGFIFRADLHDAGEKVVLGRKIAGGRGIEDGEQVLDIVAKHPSTARFIATKLIVRFVGDTAPPALVERAAQTFLRSDGDIRETLRTILTSAEFFNPAVYRAKVKTPFELVVSALRTMEARPDTTPRLAGIVQRLGQQIWGRQTPDGWPDRADAWMNSGALLNRVNFGVQLSNGGVPGVVIANWGPAKRLLALAPDAQVQGVIDEILSGSASDATREAMRATQMNGPGDRRGPAPRFAELIGVALGSPEFQRR